GGAAPPGLLAGQAGGAVLPPSLAWLPWRSVMTQTTAPPAAGPPSVARPRGAPRASHRLRRRVAWGIGGALALVVGLVGAGAVYQAIASAQDGRAYPAPGRL